MLDWYYSQNRVNQWWVREQEAPRSTRCVKDSAGLYPSHVTGTILKIFFLWLCRLHRVLKHKPHSLTNTHSHTHTHTHTHTLNNPTCPHTLYVTPVTTLDATQSAIVTPNQRSWCSYAFVISLNYNRLRGHELTHTHTQCTYWWRN